eukprot:scaffold35284_cov47-Attheya_sp.AAC.1
MPLQVPLQNVNGVESLSGRFCYGTWCSLFLAAAGKYTFSFAGQCGSRGSAGENLRESLISIKRRDWELCRLLQTFIPSEPYSRLNSYLVCRTGSYRTTTGYNENPDPEPSPQIVHQSY